MNTFFESLTGLFLLDPWLLLLAVLIPLALQVRRRRGAPAILFGPGMLLRSGPRSPADDRDAFAMPPTLRVRLLWLPVAFQALGLLLAVIALSRPVERTALPQKTEGIEILLCLDISSSMAAKDMDPARTRLDVARDAAAEFLAGRSSDRVGLLCFARYPDIRCPPTLDHAALARFLGEVRLVDPDSPEDATGIGTALARAAQVLAGGATRSKVIILLTDGEENVATPETPEEIAPLHSAQLCEQLGVRVYTIVAGIGARTPSGEWVQLDTTQVRGVAARTGGEFFTARDAGAVSGVYARIDSLERAELAEPTYRVAEWFLPFLLGAMSLILLSRLLQARGLEVLP